ncbi:peflin, putative [Entamoeba invadens IP1]|uniref:Peflin, putative n=2 Tax=Entamoeba invadens TaxID=33085 RepID=A0A0A1U840_ENTIV|nr:peflin, putative [Entamoeba invadens IP1]ELP88138.1 peflin, putative [Entamoeba invadens IP1]BAN41314.1 peflin, putative [Entamoeba invadens]BAN41690.1 peflin, putative [Entamoeba invadens]|eukprot:XP_004254909.1 peflin, putative [Entamoeba invadens IP1]
MFGYPQQVPYGQPPMQYGQPPMPGMMPGGMPPMGCPPMGMPPVQAPALMTQFNLWELKPLQNGWGGQQCCYKMNAAIKNSWWYCLVNIIPIDQYQRIYAWFMGVDRDRSGTLEINELMTGQFPGGIRLAPKTALRMMRIFDTDHNGHISFYEFMGLYKFLELCFTLFVMNDTNRSGTMEPHEILPALKQLGFFIQPATALILHKAFSQGMVMCDMNCWIAICAFAAQCRSCYQVIFSNTYYGAMRRFNPQQFGKFLDVVAYILD